MQGEYPVITLCGSTRFKDAFMEAQKRLTLEGNIVISVGLFGHAGDCEVWDGMAEGTLSETKEMLDDMHKRKIDMADSIYVINVGGYIGESTRSEIAYAKAQGKGVRYLVEPEAGQEERKRLPRDFFMTDALDLSRRLLGKIMVHETPLGRVRCIITETEAYMGVEDKGSHTYGGRRTERTEPMFHIGGTSYVYFIYGMYNCVNVAAGADGVPMASLIRMAEPADEASRTIMERLRAADIQRRRTAREKRKAQGAAEAGKAAAAAETAGEAGKVSAEEEGKAPAGEAEKIPAAVKKHLADGPGKLCIAMHITKADNAIDMVQSQEFYLTEGIEVEESRILTGKRIGIDYAEEAADYLWRFTLT